MHLVKRLHILNPLFKVLRAHFVLQDGRAQLLIEVDVYQDRRKRIVYYAVLARGGGHVFRHDHEAILLHLNDRLLHRGRTLMLLDRTVARMHLDRRGRLARRHGDIICLDARRFLDRLFP